MARKEFGLARISVIYQQAICQRPSSAGMLETLGEEVDGGDKRMSMWTDEEKRQSLMKTTQDSRVKNKKKVDPDDLNNVDVLLAAEKKLAKKLSLTVEQPVVMKETDEMFGPWTAATDEIDLDCGEMFDIKINPQTDVEVTLDDLQPQLKKELQEALKKNLEALLTSVKEKAGDGIDITMLDDELHEESKGRGSLSGDGGDEGRS